MKLKFLGKILCWSLLLYSLQCTIVTFYIDHEVEQPLDFVQISAIIKSSSSSLEEAIAESASIIKAVEQTVDKYCQSYAKDKKQCKDIVETEMFNIKPKYYIDKKQPIFGQFTVAHEMLIKVKNTANFGKLADDILKRGVNKINSFTWKPTTENDGEEEALEEGIAHSQKICKQIGMELEQIISANEVSENQVETDDEEAAEDQSQEEEDQEEQKPPNIKEGLIYYKFVVKCKKNKK